MGMPVTLELSIEQEQVLREGAAKADVTAMRRVLLEAVDSTIEKLLRLSAQSELESDFETLTDRLVETFAAGTGPDHRPLPDEAVTRDGIYGDHP